MIYQVYVIFNSRKIWFSWLENITRIHKRSKLVKKKICNKNNLYDQYFIYYYFLKLLIKNGIYNKYIFN